MKQDLKGHRVIPELRVLKGRKVPLDPKVLPVLRVRPALLAPKAHRARKETLDLKGLRVTKALKDRRVRQDRKVTQVPKVPKEHKAHKVPRGLRVTRVLKETKAPRGPVFLLVVQPVICWSKTRALITTQHGRTHQLLTV